MARAQKDPLKWIEIPLKEYVILPLQASLSAKIENFMQRAQT